jgi:2-polyprenyl-3-methyl-5-hydroxy-6-metoxy-1,4-benzoquinol methylase
MNDKTKCPVCDTEVDIKAFKEVYVSPYNNQEYKRYECPNCKAHWWEPLKIISEFYESEVFEGYVVAFHEVAGTKLLGYHKAFFKYFPPNVKGRLLDIGCGNERFIRYAKEQGFEVWGIDFDKKSVENIKKNLGIDTVFAMSLEEFYDYAKEKDLKFDVITFFEVLEHQDKPREFLEMVKGLLKDGGYIAGSVPNRERLFMEIDLKHSNIDYPPHHFLRFSQFFLEKTLQLIGFRNIEIYAESNCDDIFPYLEKKFFGNLGTKFKSIVLRDKRKVHVYVEELSQVESNKTKVLFLRALKFTRNIILLPFCFVYIRKLKNKGIHLYFQAQKK